MADKGVNEIIGDIKKNETNFFRVELKVYKNIQLLDIRQCYKEGEKVNYTSKGVSFNLSSNPEQLAELFKLLKSAHEKLV